MTHKFEELREALHKEGWYIEWGLPCCQSCAWDHIPMRHEEGPFKGKDVNYDKVLFNHEQNCQIDLGDVECPDCKGEGLGADQDLCETCDGLGYDYEIPVDDRVYDTYPHYNYHEVNKSHFAFGKAKELKEILSVIEECGFEWNWNKTDKQRIELKW